MSGQDFVRLVGNVKGCFVIDGKYPGVVMTNNQAWVFMGGDVVHPLTKSELIQQGATPELADRAGELISPETEKWLRETAIGGDSKNNSGQQKEIAGNS